MIYHVYIDMSNPRYETFKDVSATLENERYTLSLCSYQREHELHHGLTTLNEPKSKGGGY